VAKTEGTVEAIVTAIVRLIWGLRLELATAGAIAGVWACSTRALGRLGGSLGVGLGFVALIAVPATRRFWWRQLRCAHVRRRFASAVRVTRFDRTKADRTPHVFRVRETASGFRLTVQVPAGTSITDLENSAEVAAAAMGVAQIRIARDPRNAALATVSVIQREPLAGPPLPWQLIDAGAWSLWDPIPVGVDEDGGVVSVSLPEHNVLIGGEPGAGKSVALSLLVAAAALDPAVTLWLLDGKRVELATWEPCAARLVGPSLEEAVGVLDQLREEMDARYAQLLAWKRRKVSPEDGLGLQLVVIDELALYLATDERRPREGFAESLRDLIARGRAAGVIVLAATQRPSSDIVPTSVRDLFGFRWAMRCATRDSSDTILGAGWAAEGYSAADIDPAYRGVGYLLHEGGVPVRMRASYLDDAALTVLAARAAWRRGEAAA
jgi:hypothetical protein